MPQVGLLGPKKPLIPSSKPSNEILIQTDFRARAKHKHKFYMISAKIMAFRNSLSTYTIKEWDTLDTSTIQSCYMVALRECLKVRCTSQ